MFLEYMKGGTCYHVTEGEFYVVIVKGNNQGRTKKDGGSVIELEKYQNLHHWHIASGNNGNAYQAGRRKYSGKAIHLQSSRL